MRTPLMVASFFDNVDAVQALVASKHEVDVMDDVSGMIQVCCVVWCGILRGMVMTHSMYYGDTNVQTLDCHETDYACVF